MMFGMMYFLLIMFSDTVQCYAAVLQGVMDLLVPICKICIKQYLSPWAANSDVMTAHHARDKLHHHALYGSNIAVLAIKLTSYYGMLNILICQSLLLLQLDLESFGPIFDTCHAKVHNHQAQLQSGFYC